MCASGVAHFVTLTIVRPSFGQVSPEESRDASEKADQMSVSGKAKRQNHAFAAATIVAPFFITLT